MLKDFKAFILRGNVVDLAVGVVIGAAFAAVVDALVEGIFTPLLAIPGETNFGDLNFRIGGGVFAYGAVINAIVSFVVIAVAVFFFVVKPVNHLMAASKTKAEPEAQECPHCLSSIPIAAAVCAHCGRDVKESTRSGAKGSRRR